MICEFDPTLKEKMISKITDPESVKSTPFPINTRTSVYEGGQDLVTVDIETKYYGPQQDYSHQTDGDTIPFTTQVIGAIAFNGENSALVQDLYEAIGAITMDALGDIIDAANVTNKTKFYKRLGKLVANNLSQNGVVSSAATILKEELRNLVEDNSIFAPKAISFTENALYHVSTGQLLSKLNNVIK